MECVYDCEQRSCAVVARGCKVKFVHGCSQMSCAVGMIACSWWRPVVINSCSQMLCAVAARYRVLSGVVVARGRAWQVEDEGCVQSRVEVTHGRSRRLCAAGGGQRLCTVAARGCAGL